MIRQAAAGYSLLDVNRKLILICALGVLVFLMWASVAEVSQITRGQGKVIPTGKVQVVQSANAATIEEILVKNGQTVRRGQLLVRLNDAESASTLGQLETENQRLAARANRLGNEAGSAGGGCAGDDCQDEARLQQVRLAAARSRENALAAAIEQRRRDLQEGQATANSLASNLNLAREQVNMLAPLAAKGIVPQTDLMTAQRDMVDVQGRLSAARQGVARAQAAIREAQAELASARLDFRQQALNERSELTTKIAVNNETIKGASARLERNELRAPVSGIVNDLQATTVGGFVNPGEKLAQIVPVGDRLLIEARVRPSDIAFIKVGDRANIKITAYDFSVYGGLAGRVQQIAADSVFDEVEREAYYLVQISTESAFLRQGGQLLPILPGMICDVEIITGSRNILSYLLKPISKGLSEALTER